MNDVTRPHDAPGDDHPTPPPSAPVAEEVDSAPPAAPRGRTREVVVAGAAALVVVAGLTGFGLGRATAGSDGPTITPAGQQVPGVYGDGSGLPGRPDGGFRGPRTFDDGQLPDDLPEGAIPDGQLPDGQLPGGDGSDGGFGTGTPGDVT